MCFFRRRKHSSTAISRTVLPTDGTNCSDRRRHVPPSESDQEDTLKGLELICGLCKGGCAELWIGRFFGGDTVVVKRPLFLRRSGDLNAPGPSSQEADTPELDSDNSQRILNEARILTELSHPNIIRIHAYTEDPPQIIMEHHPRGSLHDVLKSFPELASDMDLKLQWAGEIASGMLSSHRHRRFVCHGDLTSINVLISAKGTAIVADYGFARWESTGEFQIKNLPEPPDRDHTYQAPEVISGRYYCEAGDVYQMGLILFELLTGQRPFENYSRVYPAGLAKEIARNKKRPELPANFTHIPGWHPVLSALVELIDACLSVYLDQRPTFGQIVEDTEKIRRDYAAAKEEENLAREALRPLADAAAFLGALIGGCVSSRPLPKRAVSGFSPLPALRPRRALPKISLLSDGVVLMAAVGCVRRAALSRVGLVKEECLRSLFGTKPSRSPVVALPSNDPMPPCASQEMELLDHSPFEYAQPPGLHGGASGSNANSSVLNFPVPNTETWTQLRKGMFLDLVGRDDENWRFELHKFCLAHQHDCPNLEEWYRFQQLVLSNPEARALNTWVKYEEDYNKAVRARASGSFESAEGGPLHFSSLQGKGGEDMFCSKKSFEGRSIKDSFGFSDASTGVLTDEDNS